MEASAPKSGRAHGLSGACSLDWSDAAGLTPEALLASRRMRRVLMAWYRSFLLLFFSPASQRWQKRHSEPASQPSSRWTNAHGLHFPAAWLAEPLDGDSSWPISEIRFLGSPFADSGPVSSPDRCSLASSIGVGGPCIVGSPPAMGEELQNASSLKLAAASDSAGLQRSNFLSPCVTAARGSNGDAEGGGGDGNDTADGRYGGDEGGGNGGALVVANSLTCKMPALDQADRVPNSGVGGMLNIVVLWPSTAAWYFGLHACGSCSEKKCSVWGSDRDRPGNLISLRNAALLYTSRKVFFTRIATRWFEDGVSFMSPISARHEPGDEQVLAEWRFNHCFRGEEPSASLVEMHPWGG